MPPRPQLLKEFLQSAAKHNPIAGQVLALEGEYLRTSTFHSFNLNRDDIFSICILSTNPEPFRPRPQAPLFASPIPCSTVTVAPYIDVTGWPTFSISSWATETGVKTYTLAFVVADWANRPSWGGYYPIENTNGFYMDEVNKIRAMGGDVIVSFGGAIGKELATVSPSVDALVATYTSVINNLGATWVDFDLEGDTIKNITANDMRSKALVKIQANFKAANKPLRIQYTLATFPHGIPDYIRIPILKSAVDNGLFIDILNVMAFNFGEDFTPDLSQLPFYAQNATYSAWLTAKSMKVAKTVGVTVMVGQNDVAREIFTDAHARTLAEWLKGKLSINFISFWTVQRDSWPAGFVSSRGAFTRAFAPLARA
ncbi:hypothetical protein HDV05_006696 [Chytridiales sp. JEL 0842]|nr:hypothetical protein HDV05_006696 [Chytridiales sp. JEL 0842]